MDVLAPTTMKNAAKCDTSDDKPFLENHKSLNAHCTSGNCREYAYLSVCKPHSPNLLRWTAVEFGVAAVRFFRGLLLHLKCRALRGHNQNTSTSSHGNRARLFHLVKLEAGGNLDRHCSRRRKNQGRKRSKLQSDLKLSKKTR